MKQDLLSIGKMADINHISIATLRLYDDMNLLKPAYIDEDTKYRYYTIEQNSTLDLIAYMKDLGMSLKEIQNVLAKENLDEIEEILSRKKEQIYQEIRKLKTRLHFVDDSINKIERYRQSPRTGVCSLEYISQRYFYGIPCQHNFYQTGISDYEKDLLLLRNHLIELKLEQVYSYNVGTSIRKEDFLSQKDKADQIFIFSDYKIDALPMTKIEASMFATIYAASFDAEKECLLKLLEFCRNNNYIITNDYLCEVMTEFNVFKKNQRGMFLRLQVPVKFNL